MSIYSKYELLEPVPDPEIRSFHAREITSGRKVVAHLMVRGYTSENNRILYRILHLPGESRQRIVEVGEYEGVPFVVTEDLGVPLTEWLSGQAAGVQSPAPPKMPPAEITPAAPPPPPVAEPEAPAPAMGEFTKMFVLPSPSAPPAVATPPVSQPPPKPPAPQEVRNTPGEFTLIFDPPVPMPPPSPVSFEQKLAAAPEKPPPPKPPPAESPFVIPSPLERAQAPPSSPSRDLEATDVFERPARPAPHPSSQASGEFTRVFSQRPAPPQPLRPPAAAPSPEEQNPARARYVLILILIFLGLLALGMILFFALKAE